MEEVERKTFRMSTGDEVAMVGLNSTSDWFDCRVYVPPAANEAEQNNNSFPGQLQTHFYSNSTLQHHNGSWSKAVPSGNS